MEVKSVQTEGQGYEDQSPESVEVGEGEDQHRHPHTQVGPGEAHRLQLLQVGLRLDGVQHGEDVAQTVEAVGDQRDDSPQHFWQAVTVAVTVTLILSPGGSKVR